MLSLLLNPNDSSKREQQKQERGGFSVSFRPENFVPGLVIGFIFGLFLDLSKPNKFHKKSSNFHPGKQNQPQKLLGSGAEATDEELKMVLVVRQDLKMGTGKIASQCAHAATGIYAELIQSSYHVGYYPLTAKRAAADQILSHRYLLRQWEQCGQAKIVVTCKNQHEMNKLKGLAESIGLPTFVIADAGRTQVLAGSKTVLAIGPGRKASIDSVTGKLRLL